MRLAAAFITVLLAGVCAVAIPVPAARAEGMSSRLREHCMLRYADTLARHLHVDAEIFDPPFISA